MHEAGELDDQGFGELSRSAMDGLMEGCQILDREFRYLYVNDAVLRHARMSRDELLGRTMVEIYPGIQETGMFAALRQCMQERTTQTMDNEFTYPDGSTGWFELRFEPVPEGVLVLSIEISARRRAEEALRRKNRALAVLSACNRILVRAAEEQDFLQELCRVVVDKGGYRMAWVGYKEHDPDRSVRLAAVQGADQGYTDALQVAWDDSPAGRGPTGRAVRTGKAAVARHIQTDPEYEPWREEATARGYASSIALPFQVDGDVVGVLNIYAAEPDAFDQDELMLLDELALDLGYGIQTIRARVVAARNAARIVHLNAVLYGISKVNELITRERNPRILLQRACELLVESRGFDVCCLLVERGGQVELEAAAGVGAKLAALRGMLAAGDVPACVRSVLAGGSDVSVHEDPVRSCPDCPVNADYAAQRDTVVVRLQSGGTFFGALLISMPHGMATDAEEITLVREVAGDVAFAMHGIELDAERSRTAEELRQSEAHHRYLFETMAQGVVYQDADGRITEANPAALRILGLSLEQMQGRTSMDPRWRSVREDGSDLPGQEHPSMRALVTGREVRDQVMGIFNQDDGDYRWISIAAVPQFRPGEDRPFQVYTTFSDITERKKLEHELRESRRRLATLLDNLPGMAYRCHNDRNWTMEILSRGCQALTGHPPEELLGNARVSYADLIHPDDREYVWREVQAAVDEGGPFVMEYRIRDAAGAEKWVWERGRAIESEDGEEPMLEGFISDITALKDAEQQLRASQRLEAVGRLAGGVAHDFNNLLTAISAHLAFALEDLPASNPIRTDLEEAHKATGRAAALTRQLLAFSRKQILEPRVLDLNQIVRGIGKMLRRLLGEDIEIEIRPGRQLGNVEADPGQIEQVIMNLAVNARDAMPRGGKLAIETANVELEREHADREHGDRHPELEPGRYVTLSVADTGCGMDAAILDHVFDPFFTTKEKAKGTGLGLATVYGIVKQSGGHIGVDSEPGRGATFTIYLPRVDAPPSAPRHGETKAAAGHDETILVVEDEDAVRKLAARILGKAGYRVLAAADGDEALRVCESHRGNIDLLLTDVIMPGMSGRELADRLTARMPGLKVLYTSGYTDDAIVHHGVLAPGTAFIAKPFSATALTARVRAELDKELS